MLAIFTPPQPGQNIRPGLHHLQKNGKIIISNYLEETAKLGVTHDMSVKLNDHHQEYIEYHRDVVFEGNI